MILLVFLHCSPRRAPVCQAGRRGREAHRCTLRCEKGFMGVAQHPLPPTRRTPREGLCFELCRLLFSLYTLRACLRHLFHRVQYRVEKHPSPYKRRGVLNATCEVPCENLTGTAKLTGREDSCTGYATAGHANSWRLRGRPGACLRRRRREGSERGYGTPPQPASDGSTLGDCRRPRTADRSTMGYLFGHLSDIRVARAPASSQPDGSIAQAQQWIARFVPHSDAF